MSQSFKEQGIDAYPLCWPVGWKRTQFKKRSQFSTAFARARDGVFHELKLMGVPSWNIILSTNVPLRRDGLPYAGQAQPNDPGVSIYFIYKQKQMVLACDTYFKVEDNLHAICKTIEALRGIERWGASEMLERSFTGFQALPPPKSGKRPWWEVLGVRREATADEIGNAWRSLLSKNHPDRGGDPAIAAEINAAYQEGMRT